MIDHFSFLESRLNDLKPGEFYPVIVLKRRKDNPEMKKGCKIVYRTNIYTLNDLNETKVKIIENCRLHNARCYVKINKRSDEKVSGELIKYVLDRHLKKEFHFAREAYDHCVGISDASETRYFLIDVDVEGETTTPIEEAVEEIEKCLNGLKILKRMKDFPICKLRTKNGYHVLAPGFDSKTFGETVKTFPKITMSIRKDADTLLYLD